MSETIPPRLIISDEDCPSSTIVTEANIDTWRNGGHFNKYARNDSCKGELTHRDK